MRRAPAWRSTGTASSGVSPGDALILAFGSAIRVGTVDGPAAACRAPVRAAARRGRGRGSPAAARAWPRRSTSANRVPAYPAAAPPRGSGEAPQAAAVKRVCQPRVRIRVPVADCGHLRDPEAEAGPARRPRPKLSAGSKWRRARHWTACAPGDRSGRRAATRKASAERQVRTLCGLSQFPLCATQFDQELPERQRAKLNRSATLSCR